MNSYNQIENIINAHDYNSPNKNSEHHESCIFEGINEDIIQEDFPDLYERPFNESTNYNVYQHYIEFDNC